MQKKKFTQNIIQWYREHKRNLPWRESNDPYRIWLSEIILQQTRVAQGIPYYLRFIERFPNVKKLAAAEEQEILRLWQGLGYYTRARNLHRCAKAIVKDHKGVFPETFEALIKLPGIGSYTAAAIASIAFKKPVAVVDGNVYRVLARVFGIYKDISASTSKTYFFDLANTLVHSDHPDEFNQGMMEFGAIWCTPKTPKCEDCIFKRSCVAYAQNAQYELPVKTKKIKAKKRYLYYLVFHDGNNVALQKREGKDIWHGLYDFHSIESPRPLAAEKIISTNKSSLESIGKTSTGIPSSPYRHILTHQIIIAQFIPVIVLSKKKTGLSYNGKKLKFFSTAEIHDLPKPVLVSRYLADMVLT